MVHAGSCRLGLVLLLLLALVNAGRGQEPDLESVLRDLTSDTFVVREAATATLLQGGSEFRARLERAKDALPLEARLRVEAVLSELGTKVRAAVVDLAPTLVRLSVQDLPLPTFLERLGSLGGCTLRLAMASPGATAANDPAVRRITMDLPEAPFFSVLDQVCRELGYTMSRDYQSGDFLLSPGQVPSDFVAYPGPLRAELTGLSLTRHVQFTGSSTSSASLQVRIDLESDTPVLGLLQPLEVSPTEDNLGNQVTFPRPPPQGRHVINFEHQRQSWLGVTMEMPDPRATKIPKLTLPLLVLVATEMGEAFDQVTDSAASAPQAKPFSLDHVFPSESELQLIVSYVADAPIGDGTVKQPPRGEKFTVLDASGQPIAVLQVRPGASNQGREVRTLVLPPGSHPSRVEARWVRRFEVRELPATFENVPLL